MSQGTITWDNQISEEVVLFEFITYFIKKPLHLACQQIPTNMDMHLRVLQSFCIRSLNTDINNGLPFQTGLVTSKNYHFLSGGIYATATIGK